MLKRHIMIQAIRCEYVHSVVEEYLTGELNADVQVAIETHITSCQDCQNELDLAREIDDILKEIPKLEPPPEIFYQVAAYVQSYPKCTTIENLPQSPAEGLGCLRESDPDAARRFESDKSRPGREHPSELSHEAPKDDDYSDG